MFHKDFFNYKPIALFLISVASIFSFCLMVATSNNMAGNINEHLMLSVTVIFPYVFLGRRLINANNNVQEICSMVSTFAVVLMGVIFYSALVYTDEVDRSYIFTIVPTLQVLLALITHKMFKSIERLSKQGDMTGDNTQP